MIGVDNQKATLNLLIDIKTNLLLNRRMLSEVLSRLDCEEKEHILAKSLDDYDMIREKIVEHLPKVILDDEK